MKVHSLRNLISILICALLTSAMSQSVQAGESTTTSSDDLVAYVAKSFHGELNDVKLVKESQPTTIGTGDKISPDPIDLTMMAKWGLHGLRNNTTPEENYLPRFNWWPLSNPPFKGKTCWDIGDVGGRMSQVFVLMREIVGEKEQDTVEKGVNQQLFSRMHDDGLIWLPPGDFTLPNNGASPWTNGLMAATCGELYRTTGDEKWKDLGGRLIDGWVKHMLIWEDNKAYFPSYATDFKGYFFPWNTYGVYASVVIPYWDATKDPKALQLAIGLTEGLISGIEMERRPAGQNPKEALALRYHDDGSYVGHVENHVKCALGALMTGYATDNYYYMDWAKNIYDYTKSVGTDSGWFPEYIADSINPNVETSHGETCITAEMTRMASRLGKRGYSECFDDLERYVRNYIHWNQFFITPAFEVEYRRCHGDSADAGLAQLKAIQGAWIASTDVNDYVATQHNDIDMMGCCIASGNLAVWEAWANTVTKNDRGIFVNMSFNHETPELKVISYAPEQGRLTVAAKTNLHNIYLRPPSWVPKSEVKCFRSGKNEPIVWTGDYVRFDDAKKGNELTITYPLVSFTQSIVIAKGTTIEKKFSQQWFGNTLMGIEPKGKRIPFLYGFPQRLPEINE